METTTFRQLLYGIGLSWLLLACKSTVEPVLIINTAVITPAQASLVSVHPASANQAQVFIKYSSAIQASDWAFSIQPTVGTTPTIAAANPTQVGPFYLAPFTINGLAEGQTYRFLLKFAYNKKDTVTLERTYTHRLGGPTWRRLAHLPATNGDFTGMPVAMDVERAGNTIFVIRYVNEEALEPLTYFRSGDSWLKYNSSGLRLPTPRHGVIQFNLYFQNHDQYWFYGLGYQTNDLIPGKYVYNRDLYLITPGGFNVVFPSYNIGPGPIAVFSTTELAVLLTQNGPQTAYAFNSEGDFSLRSPFPEPTGYLATFSIGNTGYVLNQVAGQAIHVWAYNTETDAWTRKADFPGPNRIQGIGFSAAGKGFFGLGVNAATKGLRDIWQYDPAIDQWRYSTDYPGQGNRELIVLSTAKRAFLGWGYESQSVVGSSAPRQTGCTDFWELTPTN